MNETLRFDSAGDETTLTIADGLSSGPLAVQTAFSQMIAVSHAVSSVASVLDDARVSKVLARLDHAVLQIVRLAAVDP